MHYLELLPCAALRPYVRLIWALEIDPTSGFGPPERITPDGLLEVVFHYRTPMACRYDGESFTPQPRSVAVSQTRRYLEIEPRGPVGLVSVRFHPWGAHHFLPLPVAEIADLQVDVEHLWGRAANELEERLAAAGGGAERISLIEHFLLARLRNHHKADVEPLVRAVWKRKGQVAVRQLCRDLGVGERWLQRTFAAALGTTPKGFARVSRFLHACSLLRDGTEPSLADVGLACGYYDQSHFIADFKAFSGMTPTAFLRTANVSFLEID